MPVWHYVKDFGWFDVAEAGAAKGIDVARWQGSINWHAVAVAGFRFAYIKASQGSSFVYPTTASHYQGAREQGLLTGFYHYAEPEDDPRRNAQALAMRLNEMETQLPPALDIETGSGDLSSWCRAFVDELRKRTEWHRVLIYSGLDFFRRHVGESWMDEDVLLWLARYSVPPGAVGYTSPRLVLHQFTQSGQVPGVHTNCDIDVALRPLDEIAGTDLTPEEHDTLMAIRSFLMDKVPTWDGGSQFPEGSGTPEQLNVRELLLRGNVEQRRTWDEVRAVRGEAPVEDPNAQPAEAALTESRLRAVIAEVLAAHGIDPNPAAIERAIERTQAIAIQGDGREAAS